MRSILSLVGLLFTAGCTIKFSTTRTEYLNDDLYDCKVENETMRCHIRSACTSDQMAQRIADLLVSGQVRNQCPNEWRETRRNPDAYVCRDLAFEALIEGVCR